MSVAIRNAESSDYLRVIGVVDSWWGGRRMTDMLPRLFFVHFRSTCFVADDAGEIVGFVAGFISQHYPDEAYIHFVGVHPEFRHQRLAARLYETFFAAAAIHGCRLVRCVTAPFNRTSIAFHRRMGFCMEESPRIVDGAYIAEDYDGPREDRVLFVKRIGG